jgi:hypothetical protein
LARLLSNAPPPVKTVSKIPFVRQDQRPLRDFVKHQLALNTAHLRDDDYPVNRPEASTCSPDSAARDPAKPVCGRRMIVKSVFTGTE